MSTSSPLLPIFGGNVSLAAQTAELVRQSLLSGEPTKTGALEVSFVRSERTNNAGDGSASHLVVLLINSPANLCANVETNLIGRDSIPGRINAALASESCIYDREGGACLLYGMDRDKAFLQINLARTWEIKSACRAATKALAAAHFADLWEIQLSHVTDLVRLSDLGYQAMSPDVEVAGVAGETLWLLLVEAVVQFEADLPPGFRIISDLGTWPVSSLTTLGNHLGEKRMNELIRSSIPSFRPGAGMELKSFKADAVNLRVNGRSISPHYYCYAALSEREEIATAWIQREEVGRQINL